MPKYRVMIAEFPGDDRSFYDVSKYVTDTIERMHADPKIGPEGTFRWKIADTPITMGRNRCLVTAAKNNIDYVLMIDSDMCPDLYGESEGAQLFWPTAWDFALKHNGPCALVAPYCGKPPHENVFVFRFSNFQSDCPSKQNFNLDQYSRFEAATKTGIERVAAGPTGLCLLDMHGINWLKHPRFYYEWKDESHTEKASTEDVTFFRDLNWAGCPVYCLWDCWAGHWKNKLVGKPDYYMPTEIECRIAEGIVFDAAKRLNVPEEAVKQQLEYMRRRPDEVEKF